MRRAAPAAAPQEDIVGDPVKSPMVGTAFMSPEPGAKPFVAVGQSVKAGDTLLIVEAMKVMNEVQSDYRGVIAEILVENGEAVQYEQRLMLINVG